MLLDFKHKVKNKTKQKTSGLPYKKTEPLTKERQLGWQYTWWQWSNISKKFREKQWKQWGKGFTVSQVTSNKKIEKYVKI